MKVTDFYHIYSTANHVVIDSRKIQKNDIFFAFSGENFNAATLAENAIEKGAKAVIVEQKEYENKDKNIFFVPSTLAFLQELAKYHRSKLSIPIIALTGSNGKTTTKELIHAVLSKKYSVQYTFGNLNNHIGVPLTLLSIKKEHQMAVVEMGANHQKEIEMLCSFAQPDFGYITNFGKAHLEGFGGYQGVIKGKSELYDYLLTHQKTVLLNLSDEIQARLLSKNIKTISFGTADADYQFSLFSQNNKVGIRYKDTNILSQLTGEYNFTNICAAMSFGLYFGISIEQIKEAIEQYTPTNMRSQVLQKDDKTLVLDTYNANPSSMQVALKNFDQFKGSKTIIIGDMLELGNESEKEHQAIIDLAQSLNFDEIILVGQHFHNTQSASKKFQNTDELITYLKEHQVKSKNILLKASRGIGLEKAIDFI
ncbi:MAG: UDP-N-acetylmuramoyl-tripeptide--D-alanyl-D-alanine ligase [Flavobacteriales bacterium]|nr:MAG: UDP-N-acetylmuramoyl-tripeptide--D-alanyl-D-alanine ligase [Flavobacteriales bacterium]